MRPPPSRDFEKTLTEALKIETFRHFSTDQEFLNRLNQRLQPVSMPTRGRIVWMAGFWNGVAAAAFGMILLVGLNILPPFLISASINGTGYLGDQIVRISVNERLWLEQLLMKLRN